MRLTPAQVYALVRLFEAEQLGHRSEFRLIGHGVYQAKRRKECGSIQQRTLVALEKRRFIHIPSGKWLCCHFLPEGRERAYALYLDIQAHERAMEIRADRQRSENRDAGEGGDA